MNNSGQNLVTHQIIALMNSYSFDTNKQNAQQLVQKWQQNYDVEWIHLATIEALYLGRYKAISIEQILHSWLRLGQPNIHFGKDFERLVSRKLPKHFKDSNSISLEPSRSDRSSVANSAQHPVASLEITPVPEVKITAPPTVKAESIVEEDSASKTAHPKKIVRFQPVPDASDVFQKLKALADNQEDQEE